MFLAYLILPPLVVGAFYDFHGFDLYRDLRGKPVEPGIISGTFDQVRDHFGTDKTLWKQRYWVNDKFYKPRGPIFFMINGEWEAGPQGVSEAQFIYAKWAKRFGALAVSLEHRFYGESRPTPRTTKKTLRYLSSRQALADAANFITALRDNKLGLKHNVTGDSRVIVFGGSYAGNLAAWMRVEYPDLIHGAVASSAPVFAQYNFKGLPVREINAIVEKLIFDHDVTSIAKYLSVVQVALSRYSQECVDDIQSAVDDIYEAFKDPNATAALTSRLGLCGPIDPSNEKEVAHMFFSLRLPFTRAVQNNMGKKIKNVCDLFLAGKDKMGHIERYGLVFQRDDRGCVPVMVEPETQRVRRGLHNSSGESEDIRHLTWFYQTCTEFGYYISTDLPTQPFGHSIPADFFGARCAPDFGEEFDIPSIHRAINKTNEYYGGRHLNESNIVLVNGELDPWRPLGVTTSIDFSRPAIVISGASHVDDMHTVPTSCEVKAAQMLIACYIAIFLQECDRPELDI